MEPVIRLNTLVIGTGAAGYNAALRLKELGVEAVAIATEGVDCGTSRNTGSDKQTYYKLGLAGDTPDSVAAMARDLFAGGGVDGDNALAEAALSARCFLHLCELGVPFPTNRYGEYVGYKTDHDPRARATSVGPLTSKEMTECLQAAAARQGVRVFDHTLIISLLTHEGAVIGALGLDTRTGERRLFACRNIVAATGGPGGIYADSVYPTCHHGATGLLLEAGAAAQNITQWQFGLASVSPRWNISGTYMQVLPRFVSVDADGDEHDFLAEFFADEGTLLSMVFLKGYQWPFDSRKVLEGSSVIDLLVYREQVMRGRRVYLDFTQNPGGAEELDYTRLAPEARDYLEQAGACFGRPIDRLAHMNQPAIDLYAGKGVDLTRERLEIALCAQHNNGGIAVDRWWQSGVEGLFVCGEAAGTHGVSRPGGSALNAGQVGSLRAAQFIARRRPGEPLSNEEFWPLARPLTEGHRALCEAFLRGPDNAADRLAAARRRMSAFGGPLRREEDLARVLEEVRAERRDLPRTCGVAGPEDLVTAYRLRDALLTQQVLLSALLAHIRRGDKTVGSALYYDPQGQLREGLEECFRFSLEEDADRRAAVEVTARQGEDWVTVTRPPRPLPEGGGFFENVWRDYRETGGVDPA